MKLKKNYLYSSQRQIWRLIPTNTNKLIIEEREPEKKQVYFGCMQTDSGKKIFKDFQFEEKFWVGIETVYKDIIFFHRFAKPDMPGHKGIIAFDIDKQKILWENNEQHFLFIVNDMVYSYKQNFDSRNYYASNFMTGFTEEVPGLTVEQINVLRKHSSDNNKYSDYHYPAIIFREILIDDRAKRLLTELRNNTIISGKIEFLILDDLLLFTFHKVSESGNFQILFKAVDLSTGKYILEEVLMKRTSVFVSDSFFVKDNLIFLLKEKTMLEVYQINI
jgi:hypothetical protein